MSITLPENFVKPVIKGSIDGNAFVLLGAARGTLRKAGVNQESITAILNEAMDGNYDHLLRTLMQYVEFDL